ncbi:NAD(+)--rifampin ADP-ribosyltransferase [Pseudarthrobacter sp. DSP2-3-2b1]|uniref:NAD(+)--rifampin ADP-ribosyltransferase n=1 Tax=Pseudarthrobacter sp. DSP2-3-2b1 TaxID=2804661 RepID=UPI003CE69765
MTAIGLAEATHGPNDSGPFYHGTRANLQAGNLLVPGNASGFEAREATTHIFVTASLDAARRHAEFSAGEGRGRIYRVEPTGPFENHPHLSDEGLSGNHARSYRTHEPIRVLDEVRGWQTHCTEVRGFDPSFDFMTDQPARRSQDPDSVSPKLRSLHQVLWTKRLNSGVLFAPTMPANRGDGYLIFTDASGARHWYGSDAITNSYTRWLRPKALVGAIAGLNQEQRARYLNPPYTIGSAMIWPVRSKDRPTINQARGTRPRIADRMDLTLECTRRHYAGEPESPLADVLTAYADFFALFDGFKEFVDFFHFQDLVTPDYSEVLFFLPFDGFKHRGTPATTEEYVMYREATLEFIAKRGQRIAKWLEDNDNNTDDDGE